MVWPRYLLASLALVLSAFLVGRRVSLAWLARDSSKPGRDGGEAWVLHAGAEWSEAHLDRDAREVSAALRAAFRDLVSPAALPEVVRSIESFDPSLVRSAVPNYLLAHLTAQHVKVVLTGEGAAGLRETAVDLHPVHAAHPHVVVRQRDALGEPGRPRRVGEDDDVLVEVDGHLFDRVGGEEFECVDGAGRTVERHDLVDGGALDRRSRHRQGQGAPGPQEHSKTSGRGGQLR